MGVKPVLDKGNSKLIHDTLRLVVQAVDATQHVTFPYNLHRWHLKPPGKSAHVIQNTILVSSFDSMI